MKTKYVAVALKECQEISDKAVLCVDHNGNSDILPKSAFYFEDDFDLVGKWWIAEWILHKKKITYSPKAKFIWVEKN
jgi:hypothetical protein